ncbi:MAG: hypothetical protein SO016_12470 [Lachnospiraceae bacterium]|nr:hypothetical protein [Robinsoniella sp.]MDY3767481.1 hypothetical protein [Lachnospiraceae bacterium]
MCHVKRRYQCILAALLCLMLSTTVLGSENGSGNSSASKTLVSEPMAEDPLSYTITSDSVYIQDPIDFCGSALSYSAISTSGNYNVRNFTGTGADKAVMEAYVKAICDGNYNLRLSQEYEQSYSSSFFSWGLDYTGSGNVSDTVNVTYTDSNCTICIYGTIERDNMKIAVWIPQSMEQVDLGLRYGGANQTVTIAGPSASAGLYKLSDGSFETTDGRLSTSLGYATVLRDGTPYITEATFKRDSQSSRDELWVRDFYRDETLFFCAPQNRLMTGDVYTLKDLIQEASWLNRSRTVLGNADDFDDYTWTLFFGAGHDGDFITPLLADFNEFEDLTVRVMYWDKNVEAVYYIYAEFNSSPYVIEALCAVDLNGGQAAVHSDGTYSIRIGETLDIGCPTEFGANYNLFTWEIAEGSSFIEISNTISQTCTVKANRAGTARVKVTYEYGVDEPDVLTGISRNVNRSKTFEYLITIQE